VPGSLTVRAPRKGKKRNAISKESIAGLGTVNRTAFAKKMSKGMSGEENDRSDAVVSASKDH